MLASAALHDLVDGPPRAGRVLGSSRHATWAVVGRRVVVAAGPGAVRLPNAVVVDDSAISDGFRIGDGALVVGERRHTVTRWWDPRPVLRATDRENLDRAVGRLAERVRPGCDGGLGEALARRSPPDVLGAAVALLGRGPGLTPAGDDMIVGGLAAFAHIGGALHDSGPATLLDEVGPVLRDLAWRRTPALSAALVGHALDGDVAVPVARLLEALTGAGSVACAVDDLLTVGASSGTALARGVLAGATAAGAAT